MSKKDESTPAVTPETAQVSALEAKIEELQARLAEAQMNGTTLGKQPIDEMIGHTPRVASVTKLVSGAIRTDH